MSSFMLLMWELTFPAMSIVFKAESIDLESEKILIFLKASTEKIGRKAGALKRPEYSSFADEKARPTKGLSKDLEPSVIEPEIEGRFLGFGQDHINWSGRPVSQCQTKSLELDSVEFLIGFGAEVVKKETSVFESGMNESPINSEQNRWVCTPPDRKRGSCLGILQNGVSGFCLR
ncbi:PREDICTED: uncharacterized protein LOC106752098 [Dinoponera quadriceps]|uniref:Uncharacterized protein LOC106752098 n=1 Tax=Dinoponera quadriceps TaxID=609295 RepID=A0A6P3YGT5_DINQU|nr:PREDICTED: uncharacterized protein LOC106752098 [Dinoponera quadriceps]